MRAKQHRQRRRKRSKHDVVVYPGPIQVDVPLCCGALYVVFHSHGVLLGNETRPDVYGERLHGVFYMKSLPASYLLLHHRIDHWAVHYLACCVPVATHHPSHDCSHLSPKTQTMTTFWNLG